jgi:Ribonuclease G/E
VTGRLYLDRGFGETRGALAIDGRPHRLLIERQDEQPSQRLGSVSVARIRRIEKGLNLAFLQMADGPDGLLPLGAGLADLVEGSAILVEVTAEARADKPGAAKAVVVRLVKAAEGAPRLLRPAPDMAARLAGLAPGAPMVEGAQAGEACDIAQDEALAISHTLPGGGSISIETTRALTAIDVDLGARPGGDPRRAARQANLVAIGEAARLLRLKGLGGLVVIDLVGKGHDGAALGEAARKAFAPDGAGVAIGPISRFGLFELSLPRAAAPVAERLLDEQGQLSPATVAFAMLRSMEREGRASPGGRIVATCTAVVAAAADPYLAALANRIGPRFEVQAVDGPGRRFEVTSR